MAAVEGLAVGDPRDSSTVVGPVINPPARDDVVGAALDAPSDGGRVATGGQALDGPGLFVAPTVVDRPVAGRRGSPRRRCSGRS